MDGNIIVYASVPLYFLSTPYNQSLSDYIKRKGSS